MQSEPYIQPMQSPESFSTICIVGPTGAGKTHLAMSLAEYAKSIGLRIELISMDSALVYRGLDIGSAKPTKEEQKLVAHHLIDILDPNEVYSAARFAKDAKRLCEEIRDRGLIFAQLEYFRPAIDDMHRYLSEAPEAEDAEDIREHIFTLESHTKLH